MRLSLIQQRLAARLRLGVIRPNRMLQVLRAATALEVESGAAMIVTYSPAQANLRELGVARCKEFFTAVRSQSVKSLK